jgi:adenylate cyclase
LSSNNNVIEPVLLCFLVLLVCGLAFPVVLLSSVNDRAKANIEVERRFVVCGREWTELGDAEYLIQGYLNTDIDRTVRVRIKGERGFFTVKGRPVGNEKPEIETEIPIEKARAILGHPARLPIGFPIEKTRRTIVIGDLTWQVDEFSGENQGLVVAEVEYETLEYGKDAWNRKVDNERPSWLGDEVSGDPKYFNSQLTERPFAQWTEAERKPMLQHRRGCN